MMFVKSLEITNFRNYSHQKIEFCERINILSGNNAQGKTNLLEAVYLSGIGKSPRTARDRELIKWEEQRAKLSICVCSKAGSNHVEIVLDRTENKRIAINRLPITKIGELMGVVATVFFSPGELKIVQSSPSERRSFMDIALCQMSKAYFYLLLRYNKILAQRNKLLKSGNATAAALDVWDIQLADIGSKIIKTRKGYTQRLSDFAQKNHSFLTNNAEKLILIYEGLDGETADEIKSVFLSELLRTREKDLRLGFSGVGPQKDDIKILADDMDLRSFGSQGQQRTAALSLKLSELDIFHAESGEYPILLLDDVLSELDISRQQKLMEKITHHQTIITCTHIPAHIAQKGMECKKFSISNGIINS